MLKIRTVLLFGLIVVPTTFLFLSLWVSYVCETKHFLFPTISLVVALYLTFYYYAQLKKPLLLLPDHHLSSFILAYFPWVKFFFTLPTVAYYWLGGDSPFPLVWVLLFHFFFPAREDFLAYSTQPQKGLEVISAADFLPPIVLFAASILASKVFYPAIVGIAVALSLYTLPIHSFARYLSTLYGEARDNWGSRGGWRKLK